jgi:radical SAM superfamily enzyme YgiQ (UPF0313 family)
MKVLLIAPTYQYKHHYPSFVPFTLFPSGLAYLASSLEKAGHEVVGLNPNNITGYDSAYSMVKDILTKKIVDTKPQLIGLSGLCTDYGFIKDAISIIRDIDYTIPIVLGGGIVTNDSNFIFNLLKPNFCVLGEGEEILVNLVSRLERSNYSFDDIPNLGYWERGISTFTKQDYNYSKLELRPFPNYEIFCSKEYIETYVNMAAWWYRFTRPYPKPWMLITARSCPFSCTFCVHSRGPKYRSRSIDSILEEIKSSYEKYRFNILIIFDELFAVNKSRMLEFCSRLTEYRNLYKWDFDWMFSTHASAELDEKTLSVAKKAGCFGFGYGIESASPRVLESMNKRIQPDQIEEATELASKVGLSFNGNFIFGDTAETKSTVLETVTFMSKYCSSANIMIAALRPYPGSKIFEVCLEKGIIKDKLYFYEHIDENPWNMLYNMTSVPSKEWLPLLDSLVAFDQLCPWVKSTSPYYYEEEVTFNSNPVVINTGKKMYSIKSKCPYCSKDMYHRELLFLEKGSVNTKVGKKNLVSALVLYREAFLKAIRLSILYYLSFTNPIYSILKKSVRSTKGDLYWESFFSTVFYITGCPSCRKKLKVVIPIPFTIKSFSYSELKRRFLLV